MERNGNQTDHDRTKKEGVAFFIMVHDQERDTFGEVKVGNGSWAWPLQSSRNGDDRTPDGSSISRNLHGGAKGAVVGCLRRHDE